MEPTNLDSFSPENNEDAQLAAWLRQTERALPDDGFSDRVLASLPGRRSAVQVPVRALLCIPAGALGALLAWRHLSANGGIDAAGEQVQAGLSQINAALLAPATPLTLQVLLLSAVITGASVLFALRRSLRLR
jgi:hypothetical protein